MQGRYDTEPAQKMAQPRSEFDQPKMFSRR